MTVFWLLILYLCGAVIWFAYSTYCADVSYEGAIFIAVFYPLIIALFYIAFTVLVVTMPISELLDTIKRKRMERKNAN